MCEKFSYLGWLGAEGNPPTRDYFSPNKQALGSIHVPCDTEIPFSFSFCSLVEREGDLCLTGYDKHGILLKAPCSVCLLTTHTKKKKHYYTSLS